MLIRPSFALPNLVRIKPGALDRIGLYLKRHDLRAPALFTSSDIPEDLVTRSRAALERNDAVPSAIVRTTSNAFEEALSLFRNLPSRTDAVIGLGGGKTLDMAKYAAFLAKLPYMAVPTSLSNDGFCSPQSSLTIEGRRRSLGAAIPFAVVVDVEVCLAAPHILWLSGVGDLVAKFTATKDWKLAFHANQTPVDDFAALLSDATVLQFIAHPARDADGVRTLATALMLNGLSIEIAGSSRPASGSEHLISHALDAVSARPRLHGLQVGLATYVVSRLQDHESSRIARVLDAVGFWEAIRADPFSRAEFLEAVRRAPETKPGFYTVLSSRDCLAEVEHLLEDDPRLDRCFV